MNSASPRRWSITRVADTVSKPSLLVKFTTSLWNSSRLRVFRTEVKPLSSMSLQPFTHRGSERRELLRITLTTLTACKPDNPCHTASPDIQGNPNQLDNRHDSRLDCLCLAAHIVAGQPRASASSHAPRHASAQLGRREQSVHWPDFVG